MIYLRPILQEEYPDFCEYFISDYSQEIVENYGLSMVEATNKAKEELLHYFPNGPIQSEHELLCIEIEKQRTKTIIGYLWHSRNTNDKVTFIYDFYISDEYRGKGIGTKILSIFENLLKNSGIFQIKLRVAYNNKRALKLYKTVGFSVTGYNMSKILHES